jgi:hypothetical protein
MTQRFENKRPICNTTVIYYNARVAVVNAKVVSFLRNSQTSTLASQKVIKA